MSTLPSLPTIEAVKAILSNCDIKTAQNKTALVAWAAAQGVVSTLCTTATINREATVAYVKAYKSGTVEQVVNSINFPIEAIREENESGPHDNTRLLPEGYHIWTLDLSRAAAVIACSLAGLIVSEEWIEELIKEWWNQRDREKDLRMPLWPDKTTEFQNNLGVNNISTRIRACNFKGHSFPLIASAIGASSETVRSWASNRRTPTEGFRSKIEEYLKKNGF